MHYQKTIQRREVPELGEVLHEHPVLNRIYACRKVESQQQLERNTEKLLPVGGLLDIDKAVELIVDGLQQQKRFLIVGDFDTDGATSSALAVRALRLLGASDVDYLVPNRFDFGYGLTPEIVEVAAERKPDIIITVDNGIASNPGVALAKEKGMTVVVTDHHLQGDTLPDADAIVNPNRHGDSFASKNLAGVGVIFYVMLAVRRKLVETGWFEQRGQEVPNMAQLLDLVALGTVADVVPLDQNNRILVDQGIRRIRAGECIPGISSLLKVANRQQARVVASDMGFAVAPRLNAAGRLDDMSLGIECLLTDDPSTADRIAGQLDSLNRERQGIERDMREQAIEGLKQMQFEQEQIPSGLSLFEPDWHQGVIGIVAARIKEQVHRPVIAFARNDEHELKGSARSIPGLHIRDALDSIATRHPGMIIRFGGHAMAAGLTLNADRFEEFRRAFEDEVDQRVTPEDLQGVVLSDGELGSDELSMDFAEILRAAGPWGQGFPEPVFDGEFLVQHRRIVGEKHLKLVVSPADSRQTLDVIAFNALDRGWDKLGDRLRLAYRLDINEFRGQCSLQLVVDHVEAAG